MDTAAPRPQSSPHLSVLAVVTREGPSGAQVLLVRRANPPQAGHWGFPGGKVEWGEPVSRAALRELREETGIAGANPRVIEAVDLVEGDHHHVMIAVRLDWRAGEPTAGDDALEARWADPAALPRPLCPGVTEVIGRALEQSR